MHAYEHISALFLSANNFLQKWKMNRKKQESAIPSPDQFPALQKPSHTLYCLWLAFTPKGPHYLAHFHRTQWGEKGLWSFHVLSAGCRCARGSISSHERSCLALNIYNHFASLPFWSNKVAKQRLIYSARMDFCCSINTSSRHLGPLSGVRSTAVI